MVDSIFSIRLNWGDTMNNAYIQFAFALQIIAQGKKM